MNTFIIAEAGVNHNGDTALALELVDIAADAGADAIKFQTFSADRLVREGAPKAEYQRTQTGDGDQHQMLKALELPEASYEALVQRCAARGIEFMSTPFDEEAASFLIGLGMRRIKVPSGEITNIPFLKILAAYGVPLILSTGMANLQEVEAAVAAVQATREALGHTGKLSDYVTVLHCTSNYPAAAADVNLRAMATMRQALNLPIGYSDHTDGIAISIAAVAQGASVIEKHFTISRDMKGPDHKASLEPAELRTMVQSIRLVEQAQGDGVKTPAQKELAVRDLVRRSVTSAAAIKKGEVFGAHNLTLLRPGTGIAPADLANLYGKTATHDIPSRTTLTWTDVE
ncbi:N-acetylneuraminate synthase [Achromobacter sp. HNDS-1]|jgi:N,N'-diacetyllegionaminate synthase|uniref:N-acetylneuraminate synthase n=1 Tax=Achromobacter sp. HNDS-1 TaxID=3151598 RepID=A0AAU7LHY7_9BURK|nr:N-acetylneuraminate synthase [Achromobacter ruhlandii]MCI1835416.1 N-acetylneuraminate synthase [Achromobacter ruhlandii]CAB3670955.1 N,N'-diacetyllegionaminic acid synthase [Achromobacter ruhlandii]